MDEILNDINWKPYNNELNINKNTVHIFRISIDQHYHKIKHLYSEILSEKELNKATRFINIKDTERYIVSKYLLRCILSGFTLTIPALIQFHHLINKKPGIDGIEFNVTHSNNYILIAISPTPIGIDIEFINRIFDFEALLTTCFNPDECAFINKGDDRLLNFYRLWTRKEALLKASGEGLTDDLKQVNCLEDFITRNNVQYKLNSFNIDCDYIMSLACTYKGRLNYWDYI